MSNDNSQNRWGVFPEENGETTLVLHQKPNYRQVSVEWREGSAIITTIDEHQNLLRYPFSAEKFKEVVCWADDEKVSGTESENTIVEEFAKHFNLPPEITLGNIIDYHRRDWYNWQAAWNACEKLIERR